MLAKNRLARGRSGRNLRFAALYSTGCSRLTNGQRTRSSRSFADARRRDFGAVALACGGFLAKLRQHGVGAAEPVGCSAHNAAGVACALATRVESGRVERCATAVARYGYGRARARFDAREHGVGHVESLELAVERRDAQAQRLDDVCGQRAVELGPCDSERVGGGDRARPFARTVLQEISDELRNEALYVAENLRDKALMDNDYAANGYAKDMEQEAIYAQARARLAQEDRS